jgi:hypothetical protein
MQCEVHENVDDAAGHMPYLDGRSIQSVGRSGHPRGRPAGSIDVVRPAAGRFHPVFTVQGQQLVMATHLSAAVRRGTLGTGIMSMIDHRDVIIGAIDVL